MVIYQNCEATFYMKATTNPQEQTITFENISDYYEAKARTGFIPCENGFTAEVRVLTPNSFYTDWLGVITCLVTD